MRNLVSSTSSANDPTPIASAALQHWAARRREVLLEDRLDRLTTVLERLVVALERRAS